MEFVCAQETLKAGLATIGRAAGGRTTMPVLTHVLIETQDGMLKLSATNLDVAMQAWVVAHVVEPGRATVPARLLTEFVNSLPGDADIRLGTAPTDPFSLTLHAGTIHATLRGMNPDEFPPIAPWEDAPSWLVPAHDFRTMIDQVAFSAATEMSRPVLTGVMVTVDDAEMVLSAADGYRLSVRRLNLGVDASPGTALSLLIPAKTVIEIARLLVSDQVRLEISVNKGSSQVLFRVEAPTGGQVTVIGTRLLEGVFPDLERVIPSDSATEVIASRSELMTAIRIANLFAKDAMNLIALDIFPEGNRTTAPPTAPPVAWPGSNPVSTRIPETWTMPTVPWDVTNWRAWTASLMSAPSPAPLVASPCCGSRRRPRMSGTTPQGSPSRSPARQCRCP